MPVARGRGRGPRRSSAHRCRRPARGTPDRADRAAAAESTLISAATRPGLEEKTRMRSHISTASSILCVTIRIDLIGIRPSDHRSSRSVRSVSAVSTSSAEKGSSISRQRRIDHERARKPDALAHAARQFLGIGVLESVEPDQIDRGERAVAALVRRHALRLQPELDVLQHGEPGEQREGLEHHRDARAVAVPSAIRRTSPSLGGSARRSSAAASTCPSPSGRAGPTISFS